MEKPKRIKCDDVCDMNVLTEPTLQWCSCGALHTNDIISEYEEWEDYQNKKIEELIDDFEVLLKDFRHCKEKDLFLKSGIIFNWLRKKLIR